MQSSCTKTNQLKTHSDRTIIGEWSQERYAAPVHITDRRRATLENQRLYDIEPVQEGLVEPGWQAIQTPNNSDTPQTN